MPFRNGNCATAIAAADVQLSVPKGAWCPAEGAVGDSAQIEKCNKQTRETENTLDSDYRTFAQLRIGSGAGRSCLLQLPGWTTCL